VAHHIFGKYAFITKVIYTSILFAAIAFFNREFVSLSLFDRVE